MKLVYSTSTDGILKMLADIEDYYSAVSRCKIKGCKCNRSDVTDDDYAALGKHIEEFINKLNGGGDKVEESSTCSCCLECGYAIVSDVPIEFEGKVEQICYCKFKKCMVLALGKVCGYENKVV